MKRVDSGRELTAVLNDIAEKLDDDFKIILGKLAMDAWRELLIRTPEETRFAMSNWSVAIDTRPTEEELKNPGGSFSEPNPPSFTVKGNSIVTIYNNTEYIVYLEEGTPKMRAQPMVEPTYHMITSLANRLADQLSRKKYNV